MKIYKYLSLNTCEQRQRFLRILRTGEIWFSKFHTLGDPMEGIYHTYACEQTKRLFASEKNKYLIGCFGKSARNHSLWAYYADSYSGACVEINTIHDSRKSNNIIDVAEVEYVSKEKFKEAIHPSTKSIPVVLSRKLSSWKDENELRLLTVKGTQLRENGSYIKVGQVTSVTLGINIPLQAICFLKNNVTLDIQYNNKLKWKIKELMKPVKHCCQLQNALNELEQYKHWRAGFGD